MGCVDGWYVFSNGHQKSQFLYSSSLLLSACVLAIYPILVLDKVSHRLMRVTPMDKTHWSASPWDSLAPQPCDHSMYLYAQLLSGCQGSAIMSSCLSNKPFTIWTITSPLFYDLLFFFCPSLNFGCLLSAVIQPKFSWVLLSSCRLVSMLVEHRACFFRVHSGLVSQESSFPMCLCLALNRSIFSSVSVH